MFVYLSFQNYESTENCVKYCMKIYFSKNFIMKESKFTGSARAFFGLSILSTLSSLLLFIPLIAIVPSYYRRYFDNI
jgi:hypothetical protein